MPPPVAAIICSPVRPRSSVVKNRRVESGDQVKLSTQRSSDSVRLVVLAGGAFEHHQTPAVAFITGAGLRTEGEKFSVGRIERAVVGAGADGDLAGFAAVERNGIDIGVGAGGRVGIDVHDEGQFERIGGDRVAVGAAERERRHVVLAGGEIADFGAVGVGDEQVLAAAGLPFGPMAIEQRSVDAGFGGRFGIGVEVALVAGVVEWAAADDRIRDRRSTGTPTSCRRARRARRRLRWQGE